jgi:hypothetical protein
MADESAAVAAPVAVAEQQAPATPPTREEAKARALGFGPGAQQGEAQSTESAEPVDPWAPKIPQVKPQSARERILAKQAAQQAAAQANTLQSQFEQLKAQHEQVTTQQQSANQKFEELMRAGQVNEALKVRGLSVSFEDLQREVLKARGAISDAPKDPRVDAMAKELEELKAEKQRQQEMIRQRQEQQAKAKEWQDGITAVKTELAASQLPGAAALTEVAGFNDAVLSVMMRDPSIELESAAAIVRRDFEAFFKQMLPVFQAQQAAAQPKTNTKPSPAERVGARRTAPSPMQKLPSEGLSLAEAKARARKLAITGRT